MQPLPEKIDMGPQSHNRHETRAIPFLEKEQGIDPLNQKVENMGHEIKKATKEKPS